MGLIGGIARTAVAAGTWTAVSNRVNRRQYNRWAEQDQQYAQQPAPPATATAAVPGSGRDPIEQLKDLADLKSKGILTDQEFAAQKARILGA